MFVVLHVNGAPVGIKLRTLMLLKSHYNSISLRVIITIPGDAILIQFAVAV